MYYLATGNPFINAYLQTDWFGKGVFWILLLLSAISWTILLYKTWVFFHVRKRSKELSSLFSDQDPFGLQITPPQGKLLEVPHPYFEIYKNMKRHALALINRNHFFAPGEGTVLSEADLAILDSIQGASRTITTDGSSSVDQPGVFCQMLLPMLK